MPWAAAIAAPAATSRGPRSAPPASTATAIMAGTSADRFAIVCGDDLAPLVAATHRTHPMRQPRAVALRARVVRRRADLVLRPPLCGAGVRLLLLRDGHCPEATRTLAKRPQAGFGRRDAVSARA